MIPKGKSTLIGRGKLTVYMVFEISSVKSQAVCANLGHDIPEPILAAVNKQLKSAPMVYPGLALTEIRCRLSALMSEICPGDINGFVFPLGGSDANEAAIRMARLYTGKVVMNL